MSLDDYVHRRVTAAKDKEPSGLVRTIKENRLGLWIPTGLAAIAAASVFFFSPTDTGNSDLEKNRRQPSNTIASQHERKKVFYTDAIVHNADGILLELLASNKVPESWSGINLQISTAVSNKWAQYAPVSISVPELNYITPFPAEDGATITFSKPQSLEEKITFIVTGNTKIPGPVLRQQPTILFNKYVHVKDLKKQFY